MAEAFRLNKTEWNRVFPRYMELNKRDLALNINTKLFFIARRAVIETPKAKLGPLTKAIAVMLAKIINKRRKAGGERGIRGQDMADEVKKVWSARRSSVAFLKSGWLPSIKKLEGHIDPKFRRGAARNDRSAKQRGAPKGFAIVASPGWRVGGKIENHALARRDKKEALALYGGPALQRAFDFEIASMRQYIERKMRDTAKSLGIRTN